MSLADKMKKKSAEFKPIDLNAQNVHAIFRRCLVHADTEEIESSVLFSRFAGYEKSSDAISFDAKKLTASAEVIEYLLGQLKLVHDAKAKVNFSNIAQKYDNTLWTKDITAVAELLHLSMSSGFCSSFLASSKSAVFVPLLPTLSPQDSKFAEWYSTGEWQKRFGKDIKKSESPSHDEK